MFASTLLLNCHRYTSPKKSRLFALKNIYIAHDSTYN
jgi:hypothetical protein